MTNTTYQDKKQETELRRQTDRSRDQRKMRKQKLKRLAAVVVGITVIVTLVAGALPLLKSNSVAPSEPSAARDQILKVKDSDWTRGSKSAPVTFVEYGDFQCPACSAYYPIIKQLQEEYGDRVQFVFRHFPLTTVHRNAAAAARAAQAAGAQGKFWEMHDLLFSRQSSWSESFGAPDIFAQYAQELGLDQGKFKSDTASDAINQAIDADVQGAGDIGVNATPTFFLEGKKLENPRSVEEFKLLLDGALSRAQTPPVTAPAPAPTPSGQ